MGSELLIKLTSLIRIEVLFAAAQYFGFDLAFCFPGVGGARKGTLLLNRPNRFADFQRSCFTCRNSLAISVNCAFVEAIFEARCAPSLTSYQAFFCDVIVAHGSPRHDLSTTARRLTIVELQSLKELAKKLMLTTIACAPPCTTTLTRGLADLGALQVSLGVSVCDHLCYPFIVILPGKKFAGQDGSSSSAGQPKEKPLAFLNAKL